MSPRRRRVSLSAPGAGTPSREPRRGGRGPRADLGTALGVGHAGRLGASARSTRRVRQAQPETVIRVLLADDQHIVRRGLHALLDKEPDIKVVGETADGPRTVAAVARHRPHVLLLELTMPGLNGLEIAHRVRALAPNTRVVIMAAYPHSGHLWTALRAGVSGYILKSGKPGDLVRAIHAAAAGRQYFSASLAAAAVEKDVAQAAVMPDLHRLTGREQQVLAMVAAGVSDAEMATSLGITRRTADTHRTNVMRKLRLHSRASLVCYALEVGLVRPGQQSSRVDRDRRQSNSGTFRQGNPV